MLFYWNCLSGKEKHVEKLFKTVKQILIYNKNNNNSIKDNSDSIHNNDNNSSNDNNNLKNERKKLFILTYIQRAEKATQIMHANASQMGFKYITIPSSFYTDKQPALQPILYVFYLSE